MPPFLSDFRHTINRHVFHKVSYIRLSLSQNAVFPYHYCKIQWLLFPNLSLKNLSISGNGGSSFYVDEGLLNKVSSLFEIPEKEEIDIWYKPHQ